MARSLVTPRLDPLQKEPRKAKCPMVIRMLINIAIAFAILTSPIWGMMLMLDYSFRNGAGRGDYPAVAPDADFETRHAWGQQEMFEYFELTEKWVRDSSLIAEDVGTVTGVAPIGSPNRFYAGGFTDGAYCTMNLQVKGETGEGLLTLPIVNVNRMGQFYGIADNSTWTFGDETDLILLNGRSWIQEAGVGTLVEQIRNFSDQGEDEKVVETCELLREALSNFVETEKMHPVSLTAVPDGRFANLPLMYRVEILQRYADSLAQLGQVDKACKIYRDEATLCLEQADEFRYLSSSMHKDPSELPRSLEAARIAIMDALSLRPDDPNTFDLARQRALAAHLIRCGNWKRTMMDDDVERDAMQRSLGELYDCVVYRAQKSAWLRGQLGAMSFRPKLNHDNDVRINKHGLYQAFVVVEITGTWGRHGVLQVSIRENEAKHEPLDLNAASPRGPLYPFTHRRVRWTPGNGEQIKLSAKTLAPYKKK